MSKHTPGPWRYEYEPGYCGELLAEASGTTLAEFVTEPSEANARLIAAAPELLEALKLMVEQFTKGSAPSTVKDSEARIKAHAAIAKATGEQ